MKTQIVRLAVEKLTKNTVKCTELPAPGRPAILEKVYIQQWFAGRLAPGTIVDVEVRIADPVPASAVATAASLLS